ncbi:MAG: thiamine-monophosphate kinase [Opitutaceae bacterium]|nr:thiamine-monophosphate kinase [Verrucomicrobiales bacterium]
MNEFELINLLTSGLSTNSAMVKGPGDDCAVLDLGLPDRWVLFKTDAVVELVHFRSDTEPERIGHKAIGRCLSDIAAMGGMAVSAVVTLGLPASFDPEWLRRVYAGMDRLAKIHGVAISGGETTSNPERMLISVAVIGTVEKTRCVFRSGAKVGDAIFVSGELGGSIESRHLDFTPRLKEARWLTEHYAVSSMIDLSDGLAGDLRHILMASGVGAELMSGSIPISRTARLRARAESPAKTPLLAALTDGEDFELLFTVASCDAVPVMDGWKQRFPETRLTCVGRIASKSGLRLHDGQKSIEFKGTGYTHFS